MKKFITFVVLTMILSLSSCAQSYYAKKMRTTQRLHAKQHGVRVSTAPLRQKLKYYRKRRQALKGYQACALPRV
jgi:hypothetical protein